MDNPTIEIFAAGKHRAMSGSEFAFSDSDLAATAAAYDVAKHEAPAVIGHPHTDDPAYGWVKSLSVDGNVLKATLGDIDPSFAELVKTGRFKKISAAFYAPDAKGNPTPGVYALRHVGFLGAQPPAVKGLKPIAFASADDGIVEFADADWPWLLRSIARLFRSIRDDLIADKGVEAANARISDWDIQSIEDAAARADLSDQSPAYAENPESNVDKTELDRRSTELDARAAELKTQEDALAAKQVAFAEGEKARRKGEDEALLDTLVAEGKLAPALKAPVAAFFETLGDGDTIAFAEDDKRTPRVFFRDLLSQLGTTIHFGEAAPSDVQPATTIDAKALADQAVAFVEEQKAKGIVVAADAAVRHVLQQKAKP